MSSGTVCSGLRTNLDLSGIDYLGLERVLKRGTGQVIEQNDQAVFVHDSVSGAFMLGCENADLGADILKLYIFATSGGSGIGKTAEKLEPYMKGASISDAKRVSSVGELTSWMN